MGIVPWNCNYVKILCGQRLSIIYEITSATVGMVTAYTSATPTTKITADSINTNFSNYPIKSCLVQRFTMQGYCLKKALLQWRGLTIANRKSIFITVSICKYAVFSSKCIIKLNI